MRIYSQFGLLVAFAAIQGCGPTNSPPGGSAVFPRTVLQRLIEARDRRGVRRSLLRGGAEVLARFF